MGSAEPATASIYDLIYVDRQRASSYYSQLFGDDGTPKTITHTVDSTDATGGGAKASIHVAALDTSYQTKTGQSTKHEYDPAWLIPVAVLEQFDELGRIYRDLKTAPIGSLVLITGELEILDIRMLRELWSPIMAMYQVQQDAANAAIVAVAPKSQQNQLRQALNKRIKDSRATMEHIPTFLKGMPHAVLATMKTQSDQAWCTLPVENLVVGTDDLALKHGSAMAGTWHLLGILDALPQAVADAPVVQTETAPDKSLKTLLRGLVSLGRQFFGRPNSDFGVTPVLIFRALADRHE